MNFLFDLEFFFWVNYTDNPQGIAKPDLLYLISNKGHFAFKLTK